MLERTQIDHVADPDALVTKLEELAREGKVPPQMVENMRKMMGQGPGSLQGAIGFLAAAHKLLHPDAEEEGS